MYGLISRDGNMYLPAVEFQLVCFKFHQSDGKKKEDIIKSSC